jgi:hypothetical protein
MKVALLLVTAYVVVTNAAPLHYSHRRSSTAVPANESALPGEKGCIPGKGENNPSCYGKFGDDDQPFLKKRSPARLEKGLTGFVAATTGAIGTATVGWIAYEIQPKIQKAMYGNDKRHLPDVNHHHNGSHLDSHHDAGHLGHQHHNRDFVDSLGRHDDEQGLEKRMRPAHVGILGFLGLSIAASAGGVVSLYATTKEMQMQHAKRHLSDVDHHHNGSNLDSHHDAGWPSRSPSLQS